MRLTSSLQLLSLLILASGEETRAQAASLSGYVRAKDGAAPLAEAVVEIPALQATVRSDASGRYAFASVPPGRYLVIARRIGFGPRGDSITVVVARETTRHFDLPKSVSTLDTAVILAPTSRYISPNLVGFEERRKNGLGKYLAEDELRKNDSRALSDVVRRLPGMQVRRMGAALVAASSRRSSAAGGALRSVGGASSNCFATVYQDGIVLYEQGMSPPGTQPPRLEDFQVMNLAGVEYYPGEASTPTMFRASPCGVLLLWTRER